MYGQVGDVKTRPEERWLVYRLGHVLQRDSGSVESDDTGPIPMSLYFEL